LKPTTSGTPSASLVASIQSVAIWFWSFLATRTTLLRSFPKYGSMSAAPQPVAPLASHSSQSDGSGLKEMSVLCDEQPPSTFARLCRMLLLPRGCSVVVYS
jgi:hypothetical protein